MTIDTTKHRHVPRRQSQRRRDGPTVDVVAQGYYLFLVLAVFLYLDPFYLGYGAFRVTRDIGPLKYTGLFVGLLAAAFALLAIQLRNRSIPPDMRAALKLGLPLFFFALFALPGSLYARFAGGLQESFLSVGLAMAGFPLAVVFFHGCLRVDKATKVFLGVLLASCLYVIPTIVMKRLEGGQAFHTEIFMIIPLMVYCFLALRSRILAWSVLILMATTALALHKNLGYLMLIGSALYLAVIYLGRTSFRPASVMPYMITYLAIVAGIAFIVAMTFLLMKRDEYLPSGNTEIRREVYSYAWGKFLSSPIFGDFFSGSSLVYLQGREVLGRNHVTTHSDWLDVLSHGGGIGMVTYVLALFLPIRRAFAVLRRAPASRETDYLHGLLAIALGGIVVSMFVSMFTSPPVAVLFWFNLGLIAAWTARIELALNKKAATTLADRRTHFNHPKKLAT